LLAPRQKEMQCEQGCRFRPFCLPGPCSEDEDCATEPVVCTDETWESCNKMDGPCPTELRAELCSDVTITVCKERMGVEVYDREAQAAERAAAEEANRDPAEQEEVNLPPPPKKCMSMATPKEDDWCTETCNFDETSCAAAKLCRCGSDAEIEGWRQEKQHANDNAGKQPWEVEGACDLQAHGCNLKAPPNEPCEERLGYKGLSCIDHFKHCMETPQINPDTNRALTMSTQDCLDAIAEGVRECSTCNTADSKEAFTLYVGPNYEAFQTNAATNEAEEAMEATAKADRDAFEENADKMEQADKAKSDARAAQAEEIADAAARAAIAAATSPPPLPPQKPPSPPSAPLPPSSPKLQVKDLLEANHKAALQKYEDAKKSREAAEQAATTARVAAAHSSDAGELTKQAEDALEEARLAEDEAKAMLDKMTEALDSYQAGAAPREAAAAAAEAATAGATSTGAAAASADAATADAAAAAAAGAEAAAAARDEAAAGNAEIAAEHDKAFADAEAATAAAAEAAAAANAAAAAAAASSTGEAPAAR
jgi:hypothetical protein